MRQSMLEARPALLLLAALPALCAAAPDGSAAPAAGGRPAYLPDLTQPPPPEARSPAPARDEWASAPLAPEVRVTDPGCKAKRIREWYRLECDAAYASLVSGSREEVTFGPGRESYAAWIVLPARRGDARVLLFSTTSKWSIVPDAIVSEQWLEGDPAPLITVTGVY